MTAPESAELDALRREIGRRDTYIHELHLAREADRREVQAARADVEDFVRWLREAEDEKEALQRHLSARAHPKKRGLAAWLASWRGKSAETSAKGDAAPPPHRRELPGAPFVYHLRTSPFRVYRDPASVLEGWAFPQDGQAVTGLRVRIDDAVFFGTYGLDEPAVIERYGAQPNNPKPGFKIVIETPPGRHCLSLEARLGEGGWVSILTTPIWVKA